MSVKIHNRTRLRRFLENQLVSMEKGESNLQFSVLKPLLRQTVEGLEALDYGEVQTIFAPSKKGTKGYGSKPYTLRILRMKALGFADLLISKGHKKQVIRLVAGTFGVSAARFRGWRKSPNLGKTHDQLMKSFRQQISENLDWDENRVVKELEKTAAVYKIQEKLACK